MVSDMKTLACLCFAVFLPLNLMAQDAAALRKERDKLIQRGLWRDALSFHEEKLMPVSDAGSGEDLARAVEALGRLNAWSEFDDLVERAVSSHPENSVLLVSAAPGLPGCSSFRPHHRRRFQAGQSRPIPSWCHAFATRRPGSVRQRIRGYVLSRSHPHPATDSPGARPSEGRLGPHRPLEGNGGQFPTEGCVETPDSHAHRSASRVGRTGAGRRHRGRAMGQGWPGALRSPRIMGGGEERRRALAFRACRAVTPERDRFMARRRAGDDLSAREFLAIPVRHGNPLVLWLVAGAGSGERQGHSRNGHAGRG